MIAIMKKSEWQGVRYFYCHLCCDYFDVHPHPYIPPFALWVCPVCHYHDAICGGRWEQCGNCHAYYRKKTDHLVEVKEAEFFRFMHEVLGISFA